MMNLPKDIGALPGPVEEKHFPGEIETDFDTVLASVDATPLRTAPMGMRIVFRLLEPILGAMPDSVKAELEEAVGTTAGFSRVRSTALNMILNLILYPVLLTAFGPHGSPARTRPGNEPSRAASAPDATEPNRRNPPAAAGFAHGSPDPAPRHQLTPMHDPVNGHSLWLG